MVVNMSDIPVGAADRILRKIGAVRVSVDASKELREILEDLGLDIGKKAVELVRHRKQQTITKKDIRLAYDLFKDNRQ